VKNQFPDNVLLLLATLFYQRVSIKGRTRFQKTIFLLREKYGVPFSFKFRPYYYGPYSEDLSDLISVLKAINIVNEFPEELGLGITRYNYQLTERGKKYFKELQRSAEDRTLDTLHELEESVHLVNRMNTPALISTAKAVMNQKY